MALSFGTLLALWLLIRLKVPGMVYALNIWVSLFSVVLVSQGWLVAGNLFDARQAKRLYPLLNLGLVLGAAFGGKFTKRTVALIGTEGLLPASAFMVLLAYVSFLLASHASAAPIREAPRQTSRREPSRTISHSAVWSPTSRACATFESSWE
jgi:AAA family ATP:ADP antiporter